MGSEEEGAKDIQFQNPEWLLLIVLVFMFWSIGFIDLIGYAREYPSGFGPRSIVLFTSIFVYGLLGVALIALFVSPKLLIKLVDRISTFQRKTWLVLAALIGAVVALWALLEWDTWVRVPGLQLAGFVFILTAIGVLILSGWRDNVGTQRWRKVVGYPLLALFLLELVIQVVAGLGILPGTHAIGGTFVPYERIYQNAEGFRNGIANRYGWYYPDSSLDYDGKRIIIFGSSRAMAIQMAPDQQMGTLLSEMINQDLPEGEGDTQVITIGLPGFGPGPYLYDAFMSEITGPMNPDEVIILFDTSDDFQSETPGSDDVVYTVAGNGDVSIDSVNYSLRHDLSHFFLRSYYAFQFVETIRSHYLTPKVIGSFVQNWQDGVQSAASAGEGFNMPRLRGFVSDTYALTGPNHSGITATRLEKAPHDNDFMFRIDEGDAARDAVTIAASQLKIIQDHAASTGYKLHLVTVPSFPQEFYSRYQGAEWESVIDDYDLFKPEQALGQYAQSSSMSFLATGELMYEQRIPVDEIKELYFLSGQGHLTAAGHHYFANAIFSCLFDQDPVDRPVACGTN